MRKHKREPYPVQLGAVAQAYFDDLARCGKAEMRRKAKAASKRMIDRIMELHKELTGK